VSRAILWCKFACVIAVAISGVLYINSVTPATWWVISLVSLVSLFFLVIIDRATGIVAAKRSGSSRKILLALTRVLNGSNQRIPSVLGDGMVRPEGSGDGSWDNSANGDERAITEADLVNMDQRDRQMLRSILTLDISTAREIMVPRLDMMTAEADSSLSEVADLMVREGHSRIPVYEDSIDHIVGVIHSREVLHALAHPSAEQELKSLMNDPFIIPESKRLDDLLEEFQERGVQMAIVVDEYGGTEGLVTMEDLLEEIVGEIEDEVSRDREPLLEAIRLGEALVDARVSTEDVEELFGARIDSPDVDTVGGYVYQALGRIPVAGDVVTTDRLQIEVVSVLGRRLRKLRIHRTDAGGVSPAS
jgi:CBS domain containing-hemolysin-like protein